MKDNFDLKKYIKDNKVIEKSNKYIAATLNEEEVKKENPKKEKIEENVDLKSKIKEMVLAELSEDIELDEYGKSYEEDDMSEEKLGKKGKEFYKGIKKADSYMKEDVGDMSAADIEDLFDKSKKELLSKAQDMNEAIDIIQSVMDLFSPETIEAVKTAASFKGIMPGETVAFLAGWVAKVGALGGIAGFATKKLVQFVKSIIAKAKKMMSTSKEMGAKAGMDTASKEKEINLNEIEKDESEDNVEAEEEVEVVDAEDAPAETDTSTDTGGIMGNLEAAIEKARELGDEKLIDQIGNTITFYTRQYISK